MQNKTTRHVLLGVLFVRDVNTHKNSNVQLQLSFSHLNAFIHKIILPHRHAYNNCWEKKYNYYKDNNWYEEKFYSMHICIFLIFCYVI